MNRRAFLEISGASLLAALARERLFAQASPVIEISGGRIRGAIQDGVRVFRGIPYGADTSGPNRFLPPRPPRSWTGVRDATAFGPRAFQPYRPMIPEIGDALTGSGPMSEDCLRLNVWTPAITGRRPVMVWFHGGGQRTGSGNSIFYDGQALARAHDVVVVTVTHRLNAFAHLWLAGLRGVSGRFAETANLGLRDLVLALEWVRDNIRQFGGDPGNVTIFGQSGGGGKTAMLTAFPAAKGLFHRAIIMSTLADTAVTGLAPERAVEAAELLLARLGIAPADAERLQTIPSDRIIAALTAPQDISLRFVPVVDGRTLPAHPFEPASPLSADVPILTGSNECEGIPYGNPDDPYWTSEPASDTELRDRVTQILRVGDADVARVVALYRASRPRDSHGDLAAVIAGDASLLRQASHTIAERKYSQRRAPVYLYAFNWRSRVRSGKLRSMHCMELPFIFDHPDLIQFMTGTGQDRYGLAKNMSEAWVSFARTGNPNHSGIPQWDPWNPERWPTMVFNTDTRAIDDPGGAERRALLALRAV